MVDFTTPNLCGASEQFNKLAGQFSSIKDSLQGQLEGEIDALKSELTSSLSVLEADIKGLIPELPDIPDVSLISEIQGLLALPTGSPASLTALTSLTSQFGAGLAAAGQDLDSLISSASSALSGGIDLCGGTIPNFVIGPDGSVKEKPQDAGMPDGDPVDEDGAELITPSAEISSVNASIESDADSAASSYKEKTSEVRTVIPSETGEMSNATQDEFNKADAVAEAAAVKAKVPSDPQTAKVKDAVLTNKTLPPKEPVIKPTKLTDDEEIEIISLKNLQDELSDFENQLISEFKRLRHLLIKYRKKFPDNITADGKRKIVFLKGGKRAVPPGRAELTRVGRQVPRASNVRAFLKFYELQIRIKRKDFKELNKRIDRRRNDILVVRTQTGMDDSSDVDRLALTRSERAEQDSPYNRVLKRRGTLPAEELEDIFNEIVEGPRRVRTILTGNELIDFMEQAYPIAEETFSVPISQTIDDRQRAGRFR
tara:strand:- start:4 stop:1455 length:1452 start_codon:yes stop_codon:yes gene_type:complete